MANCFLCPRACGADRDISAGFMRCGSAAPRSKMLWLTFGWSRSSAETRGSGAVFFSAVTSAASIAESRNSRWAYWRNQDVMDSCGYVSRVTGSGSAHHIILSPRAAACTKGCGEPQNRKGTRAGDSVVYTPADMSWRDTLRIARRIGGYLPAPDWKFDSPLLSATFSNAADYGSVAICCN
jgi:hypothetical protein